MWRYLARDRFIQGGFAILVLTLVALLWPGLESWSLGRWLRRLWELPPLLLVVAALLWKPAAAKARQDPPLERRFWIFMTAASCLWLTFALYRVLFADHLPPKEFHLLDDALMLALLFSFVLSTEVRPDLGRRGLKWSRGRSIEEAGTVLFGVSLFLYFVWIPATVDSPFYLTRLPTATLLLSLTLYLLIRFLYQATNATEKHWRWIFLWMMGASLAAVTAVLVVLVGGAGGIRAEGATPKEGLFYLALVGVLVAARLRGFSPGESPVRDRLRIARGILPTRFTGRLMVYALLLPGVHFALGSLALGSTMARAPQERLLLLHVMVLGLLAMVQHRSLERRHSELYEESRQAEERLLLLTKAFETMRLGVTVKDPEGRILYVNPAQARMHGYEVAELLGRRAAELGPPELRHNPPPTLDEVVFRQHDTTNVRRDGTSFPVHLISDLVRDAEGKAVAVVTTCEDISERTAMEEALRLSEREYRGLFENAHDAILILRPDDEVVLDLNPSASQLYGLSREAFLGMSLEKLSVHPLLGRDHIQRALRRGDVYDFETEQYRSDGSIMHLEVRAGVIQYRGETAFLSINRDITERKRAEAALKAANEELKTFLSLVSHDLRAPLVNLKGFAAELAEALEVIAFTVRERMPVLEEEERRKLESALFEDAPEAMEFIESSVGQMDYFIEALLGLSRAGRREVEIETVDAGEVVPEVLDTLSYQIGRTGAEVTVADLPTVRVDRFCLTQIFANLLTNAVAYQQPGRSARIQVEAEVRDTETRFRVRDNGRGIAPDDQDKIFQPFRRSGKQDVPGEGMGLAYVQTLVRRLGGTLWLESQLGVGSTFSFSVPARSPDEDRRDEDTGEVEGS